MTAYVPGLDETDLKKLILSLQQLAAGRSNAAGSVTLTANAASTAVSNDNFAAASTVYFTATTSNAAAGVTAMYISARAKGSFTITHANNAQTDRTYLYAILG